MKQTLIYSLLCSSVLATSVAFAAEPAVINGAGATFPYPIYAKWASVYEQQTGIKLNYQAIGSGGGIKQIKAKTTDFGASDAPLKGPELEKANLMQFPMIMGGVVPIINVEGIAAGKLKLSGEVLADIYMGKILKWNDPKIQALNPGFEIPDERITTVHRSDGSGTTFIFTNYLSKVSQEWQENIGSNKDIAWPAGVGGKGNQGVASYVQRIKGSIGYVEYAYALQNNMSYVLLQNKSGNFVAPTLETFQAAAANADWKSNPSYYVVLTNQEGEKSWPITGASFILLHKTADAPKQTQEVLKFFDWAYKNGQEMAAKLDYVPMPKSVVELVAQSWKTQLKDKDQNALWPIK